MRCILFRKAFPWLSQDQKELPTVELRGDKVLIREKIIEDIPDEYEWRVDDELSRLDATRPLSMSYEDFHKYSKEEMQFPSYRSKRLAVDTLHGIHIGNVMYYDLNMGRKETELGIMIGHKEHWGKGYGTDAVVTVLRYLFSTLGLQRVYLHTLAWNYRAQSAFSKSGFKRVKSVRRGGQDFILMEVLSDEWKSSSAEEGRND